MAFKQTMQAPNQQSTSLSQNLVRKHKHGLNGLGGNHSVRSMRLSRHTLQAHLLRSLLSLDGVVLLHTVQVLQSAFRRKNMLDLDMNSLLDNAVSDLLVDLHTHSSLGHVENDSSSTMISLEGHTLVNSSVRYDIDVVSNSVATHVSGERNHSMIAETSLKHVTSTGTISVSMRHCLYKL